MRDRSFTLAVSGHRRLSGAERLWLDAAGAEALTLVTGGLGAVLDTGPVQMISALAAGADQRLASLAVAHPREMSLRVLLPFARAPYRARLAEGLDEAEGRDAQVAFDALCRSAGDVIQLDAGTAPHDADDAAARYRLLALELAARADLLLAVWRGGPAEGPGGTAEVVDDALASGVPVLWLAPFGPARGLLPGMAGGGVADAIEAGPVEALERAAGHFLARRESAA